MSSTYFENQLTTGQRKLCGGHVTIDASYKASNNMKDNKNPGLTAEFYKQFWDNIEYKTLLIASFNDSYDREGLSDSQNIYEYTDTNLQEGRWTSTQILQTNYISKY